MGLRIMIVDDSSFERAILRKRILSAGAEVAGEAEDGAEAVEMYQKLKPDLVLMVIFLPKMNGMQAMRAIKANNKDARIAIYTSAEQELIREDAIQSGACEYLKKPLRDKDIVYLIKKYSR